MSDKRFPTLLTFVWFVSRVILSGIAVLFCLGPLVPGKVQFVQKTLSAVGTCFCFRPVICWEEENMALFISTATESFLFTKQQPE